MVKFDLRLRITASNLSEFTKKLKDEISRALSEAMSDSSHWRDVLRNIDDEIKRGMSEINRKMEEMEKKKRELVRSLVDDIVKGKDEIEPEKLTRSVGVKKEAEKSGGLGSLLSGLSKFISSESAMLLGIFSILGILKMMYDGIMKIVRMGEMFSGYAQAVIKLLNVIFGLALKPIADVISVMLLPILLALLKYVIIPWSKITAKVRSPSDALKLTDSKLMHGGLGVVGLGPIGALFGGFLDKLFEKIFPKYREMEEYEKKYHVMEAGVVDVSSLKKAIGLLNVYARQFYGAINKIVDWMKEIRLPEPSVIADKVLLFAKELRKMFSVGEDKFSSYVEDIVSGFGKIRNYIFSLFSVSSSPVPEIVSGFDEIKSYVFSLFSGTSSPVPEIVSGFKEISDDISGLLSNGIIDRIVNSFKKIADALLSAEKVVKSYLEDVINTAKGVGDWLKSLIREAGGAASSLQSAIVSAEETVSSVASDISSAVSDAVSSAVSSVSSVVNSAVSSVVSSVSDAVSSSVSSATSSFSSVASSLSLDGALYNAAFGGGGYQIGSFISKTGMYLLHSGEVVVPSWDVRKEETKYEVNININANVRSEYDVKRIAEEVERVLNDKMMRRGVLR